MATTERTKRYRLKIKKSFFKNINHVFKDYEVNSLKRFWTYLHPHRKWLILACITIPIATLSSVILPWLIVQITDQYIAVQKFEGLLTLCFIFFIVTLVGAISDAFYAFSLQISGQLTLATMRQDLYNHTLKLPRKYYDKNPIGFVISRITSDFESIGESFAGGFLTLIIDLIKTFGLFLFLFYLDYRLAFITTFIVPILLLIMRFIRKRLRRIYEKGRKTLAESVSYLQECLQGIQTVQIFAAEEKTLSQFKEKNVRFLNLQLKSNWYESTLFSLVEGITGISVVLVIWYGSSLIYDDNIITIGVLIGFINALQRIFIPIREFTQQLSSIQRALAALSHINKLFLEPPKEEPQIILTPKIVTLESIIFRDVSFAYNKSDGYVLKNINFQLHKGMKLAFVGATGSGKSTIIRLLGKQYTHYEGSILINGYELRDIPTSTINKLCATMHQDVHLFNETIRFNIELAEEATEDLQKVKDAAHYVHADTFIEKLPETYDTILHEGGKNISIGQGQLIALARIIYRKPQLFILDEATSAVDSITEHYIANRL